MMKSRKMKSKRPSGTAMPALENPLHFVLSDEEPVSSRYQTPTSSTFGICSAEIQSGEVPDR
jgi:hypothetical protein